MGAHANLHLLLDTGLNEILHDFNEVDRSSCSHSRKHTHDGAAYFFQVFDKVNFVSNKGADQTVWIPRLVCALVVHKPPKTGLLASSPKYFKHNLQ